MTRDAKSQSTTEQVECDYCDSEHLAYALESDRGIRNRCIRCLAIEQGQQQFRMPFETFIDNEKQSIVYPSREEWDETRRMSYEAARDWYRVLARIAQDEPLLKRNSDDFGALNERTRTFLMNIMGKDVYRRPSEVQ